MRKHRTALPLLVSLIFPLVSTADIALTILHTNDFHARFEPINKFDSGCSHMDNADGKCFGGSARLANAIKAARGSAKHTILVDGGVGPYPTMVRGVAIVQAYAYGKYLGVLNAVFDDDGKLKSTNGDVQLLDGSVTEDEKILARINELAEPLDAIRNQVVANTGAVINGARDDCRVRECEMGNLVADAMLARVENQGIDVAIQNSGGLRASIDGGDVTMGEVLTVLPFLNTLATFELTGEDLLAALENGVSQVEDVAGRFPQISGMRFVWDKNKKANEGRIVNVEIRDGEQWKPLQRETVYGIVSNNFLRTGGDGYRVFAENARNAYDFGPGLEYVLAEYLKANSPYKPYIDARIKSQ